MISVRASRIFFLSVIFLLGCSRPPSINQEKIDNARKWQTANPLGNGFNQLSGKVENLCIDFVKISHYVAEPQIHFDIVHLHALADLSDFLNLSSSDHFQLTTKILGRELDFFNRALIHSHATFVGIRISQPVLYTSAQNPALLPAHESYLRKEGHSAFVRRCGHLFIKEFSVTVERVLIAEIPSHSHVEMESRDQLADRISGHYNDRHQFEQSLEQLRRIPRVLYHDPTNERLVDSSEALSIAASKSIELYEQTSFGLAPFPIVEQNSASSNGKRIEGQHLLLKALFRSLQKRNDLLYVTRYQNEFINPQLELIADNIQQLQQQIRQIRQLGKKCAYSQYKCNTSIADLADFTLPRRISASSKRHVPMSCETPIYNFGKGISCGVKAYQRKRSKHCGVELYKELKHRHCPGYIPPGGPKILREEQTFCSSEPMAAHMKQQLNQECQDVFGDYWVFSDVTEEYSHRALNCQQGAEVQKNKALFRCIRLARVTSCRHPKHGVSRYQKCEHPAHGILSYHECRSPEFGIQSYEAARCTQPTKKRQPSSMNTF